MHKEYIENGVLNAPGLTIKAADGVLVKAANAFAVKANSYISSATSANTDMPSLATALNAAGANPGNLATGYSRIYSFFAAINTTTGALTFTIRAGADFANRVGRTTDRNYGNAGDESKALVGFVTVINATGSAFVPNTTALDISNLTVRYNDAFGYVGK